MKEFIGLIKLKTEAVGMSPYKLLVKFSDDLEYLVKWNLLYPDEEMIVVKNEEELQDFFQDFEDGIPVTPEEMDRAQRSLDEIRRIMST